MMRSIKDMKHPDYEVHTVCSLAFFDEFMKIDSFHLLYLTIVRSMILFW
uniref:Uncharacterized protein n=1 Tax=Arundo donax TaxID=35708 RepID=A0A0A9B7Y2_ARUDO